MSKLESPRTSHTPKKPPINTELLWINLKSYKLYPRLSTVYVAAAIFFMSMDPTPRGGKRHRQRGDRKKEEREYRSCNTNMTNDLKRRCTASVRETVWLEG